MQIVVDVNLEFVKRKNFVSLTNYSSINVDGPVIHYVCWLWQPATYARSRGLSEVVLLLAPGKPF